MTLVGLEIENTQTFKKRDGRGRKNGKFLFKNKSEVFAFLRDLTCQISLSSFGPSCIFRHSFHSHGI